MTPAGRTHTRVGSASDTTGLDCTVMERSAAVLMAAAAAFILLYHWRRRRKYNLKASALSDPTTLSADAFASHAQNTAQPNQCVLIAASTHGIRNLWQGSFSLIAADLRATLGHHHAANSLSLLEPCLADAFALRKELVNLKKACLRTFHDVDKVIEQLQRQDQYFFRDTSSGHVRGCVALAPLADAPLDLDAHRAEYESVCHCFQRAKGLILAMHDARDFTKFLCSLPRHPDDCDGDGGEVVHRRLKTMPDSFKTAEAVVHAEAFLSETQKPAAGNCGAVDASSDCSSLTADVLVGGLGRLMSAHRVALPTWPPHVHDFVRLSLIARGGAKALSIRDGLRAYCAALKSLHVRTLDALKRLAEDEKQTASRSAELGVMSWVGATEAHRRQVNGGNGDDDEDDGYDAERISLVRRRMICEKHLFRLSGISACNEHLLRIVEKLLERHEEVIETSSSSSAACCSNGGGDAAAAEASLGKRRSAKRTNITSNGNERLFVAGDSLGNAMFYPPEFGAIREQLNELAKSARRFEELQKKAIEIEGWPPPPEAMRTRVRIDGALACSICDGTFSRQWVARGVCWRCEASERASGRCPFETRERIDAEAVKSGKMKGSKRGSGKAAQHYGITFCAEQGKCVVCDGGFAPSASLRLAQGDGETVAAICSEWSRAGDGGEEERKLTLFFDFDQTWCSTKAGGSPLQGKHSLDDDLTDLATQHTMYVVTRNSHKAEIEQFLQAKGVRCEGVLVARKGKSKAAEMLRVAPSLADPNATERAIFVDDGVREVCDEKVVALPGLYRVLFRRGAVV